MKHCLIVDQGDLSDIVKYDSLVNAYKSLFKMDLDLLFFLKKHPVQSVKYKDYYIIFKDCTELVDYVPVELFFQYIDGCVVAPYCSSLMIASGLPGITAISLLDILDWYDMSFKEEVKKNMMKQSYGKVLFPCDIKELEYIIKNRYNNE